MSSDAEDLTCAWYKKNTCCSEVVEVYAVWATTASLSLQTGNKCADELNMLACRYCSPKYGTAAEEDKIVCDGFVKSIWDACKDVRGEYSEEAGLFLPYPDGRAFMREAFEDKSDFFERFLVPTFQLNPTLGDSDSDYCFSAGASVTSNLVLVVMAVLAVVLMA